MVLVEKYSDRISGVLNSYDRVNIRCVPGAWGYADGMGIFFNTINRRCFDFHNVFKPVTDAIVSNAEEIAARNGLEIEYINKVSAFRKDDKIAEILEARGYEDGLVKIYSQLETCNTYRPWTDIMDMAGWRRSCKKKVFPIKGWRTRLHISETMKERRNCPTR